MNKHKGSCILKYGRLLVLCTGIFLFCFGLSVKIIKPIITETILEDFDHLEDDSVVFKLWKDPPYKMTAEIFAFSLNNRDEREYEIFVFLCFMIFYKNRRTANWAHYLSNVYLFAKLANIFLFSRTDLLVGIIYSITMTVHLVLCPDVVCADGDEVTIFNSDQLHLDVGRWPKEAERFRINTHPRSQQLPTCSLFKAGKEIMRRPTIRNKRAIPFKFSEENCILEFGLHDIYNECKTKMNKVEVAEFKEKSKKD